MLSLGEQCIGLQPPTPPTIVSISGRGSAAGCTQYDDFRSLSNGNSIFFDNP